MMEPAADNNHGLEWYLATTRKQSFEHHVAHKVLDLTIGYTP